MDRRFRVYEDMDEEAFQRSLLGQPRSKQKASSRSTSQLERQTAGSKVARFLQDSSQSLGQEPYRANFLPFEAEFPTFQDMTTEQRDYYLYWRYQFLEGAYLVTDEGYLLCFAYEIINQTLFIDVARGAGLLLEMLSEYGDRFPSVTRQFVRWIEDYYSAFLSVDRLYQDLREVDQAVYKLFDCGRFLPAIFDQESLQFDDICALTAFSQKRSLFSNNWEQMEEYRQLLPEIFAAVDNIVRNRTGKSWLCNIPEYERRAFPGAVYGGSPQVTTKVIDFSPGLQRDVFSKVARLVELLMGQEVGYGNKKMTSNIQRLKAQMEDEVIADVISSMVAGFYR